MCFWFWLIVPDLPFLCFFWFVPRISCVQTLFLDFSRLYSYDFIWVFPKIRVPQNGWFIMENPIEMDDLGAGYHYFRKHPYVQVWPSF